VSGNNQARFLRERIRENLDCPTNVGATSQTRPAGHSGHRPLGWADHRCKDAVSRLPVNLVTLVRASTSSSTPGGLLSIAST
jgi:hypothetical protein